MGKKGFTLLELLIVIVIIGILATIGLPRYFNAISKARKSEAAATLGEIRKVEQAYFSVWGAYKAVGPGVELGVDVDGGGDDISIFLPNTGYYTYTATTVYTQADESGSGWSMDHASGALTSY